jgi:hypothetical protein
VPHALLIASFLFNYPTNILQGVQITQFLIMQSSPLSSYFLPLS